MDNTKSGTISGFTRISPLTIGNIALALLSLPFVVILLGITNTHLNTLATIGIHWVVAILVVGIAIVGENQSLSDLGFRTPDLVDFGYLIVTSLSILLVYIGTTPMIEAFGLPVNDGTGLVGSSAGIGMALAYAVTIGIVEEVLYRGYPIERLYAYTDSALVAGGVTWSVFTIVHALNWPLGSLLQTSLVSGVLTVVYLRRRTLAPVIGAHVTVWVVAAFGQFYALSVI